MTQKALKGTGAIAFAFAAAMALAVLFCIAMPSTAQAATASSKTIYNHKTSHKLGDLATVSKYDVTGDKKKDMLSFLTEKSGDDAKLTIYIGNYKALTVKAPKTNFAAKVKLLTLKNGKKFLFISTQGGSDDEGLNNDGVYRYKSHKLKAVLKAKAAKGLRYNDIRSVKVSGNSVTVKYNAMSLTAGVMQFSYKYKYKKGTLKAASSSSVIKAHSTAANKMVTGWFTAAHNINAKASASSSAATKVLAADTKVKFTKVALKGKVLWFKVKSESGSSYWIKNSTKDDGNGTYDTCFKEAILAG